MGNNLHRAYRCLTPALVGAMLLLSACSTTPRWKPLPAHISWRASPTVGDAQRVAVLPAWAAENVGRSADSIAPALAAALRETGRYEVTPVGKELRDTLLKTSNIPASIITAEDLGRLRDKLQVDAVLVARVEQFTAYDPLAVGLTVHLVSCQDGTVLWSATGNFDSRREDIQNDIQWWHSRHAGTANDNISGWRLTMSSPELFCRYVADRLCGTLVPHEEPKPKRR